MFNMTMSLSYVDVISELFVMVRDGALAFTDSHTSTAHACSFTEFSARLAIVPVVPWVGPSPPGGPTNCHYLPCCFDF